MNLHFVGLYLFHIDNIYTAVLILLKTAKPIKLLDFLKSPGV